MSECKANCKSMEDCSEIGYPCREKKSATMTITNIEKAAKLMGCEKVDDMGFIRIKPDGSRGAWFNPYTNKADLVDVECALIGFILNMDEYHVSVVALSKHPYVHEEYFQHNCTEKLSDHPDKFTARASAVMAVVEQIHDAKFGKDGE